MVRHTVFLFGLLTLFTCAGRAAAQPRAYRLPDVDIKQRVIWGSEIKLADGTGLAFGGQDQDSDYGRPHTRILKDGRWLHNPSRLSGKHSLDHHVPRMLVCAGSLSQLTATVRAAYFRDETENNTLKVIASQLDVADKELARTENLLSAEDLPAASYAAGQRDRAAARLSAARARLEEVSRQLRLPIAPKLVTELSQITIEIDKAVEAVGTEPPARALSPLVYDKQANLYVLFGGDHLDYLTGDTWVFDPQEHKWQQRHPPGAPPPRANHKLVAAGDGTVQLSGGYTYTSNTGYVSGQYIDIDDGPWTYDIATNRWRGEGQDNMVAADTRVYRSGPFHPDFYLEGAPPDRDKVSKELAALAANTWVRRNPPRLPRLNRDWGTAVIDPDHDILLRFSGGHSAHGGSDVLHYHFATNRWELTFPVEFPLGQLYANTRYPQGYNFNQRPWVTGHTYKSYAYDPLTKTMLFTGRPRHTYIYAPTFGDWVGRTRKPQSMAYNSCFYTLTLCPTPRGVYCWTKNGDMLRYEAEERQWSDVELTGDTLRGTVVDRAGISYDAKRDQLICLGKTNYRGDYDGIVYTVELKTGKVTRHQPAGLAAMSQVGFLREQLYDPQADLVVIGALLPPDDRGFRRTPAYDPAANRWVSLKLSGDHPHGNDGRNVSLGYMYDASRKLHWAVDTNSQVYVLRSDHEQADVRELD